MRDNERQAVRELVADVERFSDRVAVLGNCHGNVVCVGGLIKAVLYLLRKCLEE